MFNLYANAIRWRASQSILLLALFSATAWAAEDETPFAGTFKSVHGEISIHRGKQSASAQAGARLLVKDVVQSGADGSAGIILHDGTRLSMGPGSTLTIDEFVFEPADCKLNLAIRVLQGVVAYASGKIAQLSPKSVRVETPVAIIGLRGTHFAVAIPPSGAATK